MVMTIIWAMITMCINTETRFVQAGCVVGPLGNKHFAKNWRCNYEYN